MSKLTEDETIELLRETFADRERLGDTRPEITTSSPSRRAPMLLAAASILVVLAGVFVVTDLVGTEGSGPAGQAVTQAPSAGATTGRSAAAQQPADDAAIWAAVAAAGTDLEPDARPWPIIFVRETPDPRTGETARGAPFTPAVRQAIEAALARLGPVQWVVEPRVDNLPAICGQRQVAKCPSITLGAIVRTGDLADASVQLRRGCATYVGADYQLRRRDSGWAKPNLVAQSTASLVC